MSPTVISLEPEDSDVSILSGAGEVVDLLYGEQTGNITSGEPSTETDPS